MNPRPPSNDAIQLPVCVNDLPSGHAPTEEEVRAFVGPRADRYWRRWRWYIEHDTQRAGTLWGPFFFNFVWFLYRRMYRELWVPIVLGLGVAFAWAGYETIQELSSGTPYITPKGIDTLISVGFGFATSWLGSLLYLRKLRKAVAGARRTDANTEAQIELLQAAGGTSWVAAIIGAVLLTLLFLGSLAG